MLTPRCFAVGKKRGRKLKEQGAPTVPRALAVLQTTTLNARHCRDGMHAYRVLRGREGTNSVPPSMLAAAMKERTKQHRAPRAALVARLMAAEDLPITLIHPGHACESTTRGESARTSAH